MYGSPYYLFAVLLINFPTAIATVPIASLSVVLVVTVAVTLVCLRTAIGSFCRRGRCRRGRWWHVIRVQTLTLIGECAYHASNAMLVTVRTAVVRLQKVPNK